MLGIFETPNWRVGAGISWHSASVLKGNTPDIRRVKFESATGAVVQFDLLLQRWTVGFRFVDIDYVAPSRRLDASHWGIAGGYRFGRID